MLSPAEPACAAQRRGGLRPGLEPARSAGAKRAKPRGPQVMAPAQSQRKRAPAPAAPAHQAATVGPAGCPGNRRSAGWRRPATGRRLGSPLATTRWQATAHERATAPHAAVMQPKAATAELVTSATPQLATAPLATLCLRWHSRVLRQGMLLHREGVPALQPAQRQASRLQLAVTLASADLSVLRT